MMKRERNTDTSNGIKFIESTRELNGLLTAGVPEMSWQDMFDDEENLQPPSTCPRCGRTTNFGGRCECEQILW